MQESRIGVDESGKGDYFGPLIVAACYVGPEHLPQLGGVRDSKSLSDSRVAALAATIKDICPFAIVAISPEKYNELHQKMRNVNRILAWGHARAVENVLEKQPAPLVVSDQFADPEAVKRGLARLAERIGMQEIRLESRVRAEDDVAVACASILARAEFLRRLKRLSEEYGVQLPKGAGPQVLAAAREFVRKHGQDWLAKVAKVHFKTTRSVVS